MKINKLLLILLMIISTLLILIPTSNAALQSNGGTATSKKIDDWMINIRNMESTGGTLGLDATIGSDLLDTSTLNNLDIHMEKNTEYGAMAILSASSYGNPNIIADSDTTTGNKTGVVIKLNSEWVAAGAITSASIYSSANSRYKDNYSISYVAKYGDSIKETEGWHGTTSGNNWLITDRASALARSLSTGIFSYNGNGDFYVGAYGGHSTGSYYYLRSYPSRAVVVVGEGI